MSNAAPAFALQFDMEALRPLIAAVVSETLAAMECDRAQLNGKLAFSESEAAQMLGLNRWQIRDLRRADKISASQGPGRRILYARQDLEDYLARQRIG